MFKDCIPPKRFPLYNYFYMYKFGLILYQGLTFTMIFGFARSRILGVESLLWWRPRRPGACDGLLLNTKLWDWKLVLPKFSFTKANSCFTCLDKIWLTLPHLHSQPKGLFVAFCVLIFSLITIGFVKFKRAGSEETRGGCTSTRWMCKWKSRLWDPKPHAGWDLLESPRRWRPRSCFASA